jgi:ATP-dependent Clp protease ATP-binding subunit ClpC
MEDKKMSLELTEEAKAFIAEKGFDEKYGARPLRRAMQKYIEDTLAEKMLSGDLNYGSKVSGKLNDEKDNIDFAFTEGIKQIDEKELDKPEINVEDENDVASSDAGGTSSDDKKSDS